MAKLSSMSSKDQRLREILADGALVEATKERIRQKTRVTEGGCWVWEGAVKSSGHGMIAISRTPVLAHRLSWALHYGRVPTGMVLHKCPGKHNPSCVNPLHLSVGDAHENSADAIEQGVFEGTSSDREEIKRLAKKGSLTAVRQHATISGCSYGYALKKVRECRSRLGLPQSFCESVNLSVGDKVNILWFLQRTKKRARFQTSLAAQVFNLRRNTVTYLISHHLRFGKPLVA